MRRESSMSIERWLRLMDAWGFSGNEDVYQSVVAVYSAKSRHYHNAEHVTACLRHLDRCIAKLDQPREVELALWFHDAIYQPFSSGNERKSADWAASFLSANDASHDAQDRVRRLIMVTQHNEPTRTNDESMLVDIDLSILGSDSRSYRLFEQAVRMEYRLVPSFIYRKRRAGLLRGFLARERIYQNEPFASEREGQARKNLTTAVSELEK